MKDIRISLILAVFCPLVCSPSSIAEETSTGWRLIQDGDACGPHKSLVSKHGMRCENPKARLVVTAKSPKWDVILSNTKSKTYCVIPYANFHGEMGSKLFDSDRIELKNASWKLDGNNSFSGQSLNRYKMVVGTAAKAQNHSANFIGKATFWTFKNLDYDIQVQELLSKIFLLPPQVKGIPFRLSIGETNGGWFDSFNTGSAEKIKTSEISLDIPKGFVLKKTQEEVLMDPVSKDVFETMTKWSEPKLDKKN